MFWHWCGLIIQSAGGRRESTRSLITTRSCSSFSSVPASFTPCARICAYLAYSPSPATGRTIPAKSNLEIRVTFKPDKKELRSVTYTETPLGCLRTQSDHGEGGAIGRGEGGHKQGIYWIMWAINEHMTEGGAAVGTTVQLQTKIIIKQSLHQVQIGNFHISCTTQEQQQLAPAPYIPNYFYLCSYTIQTRKWFVFHRSYFL